MGDGSTAYSGEQPGRRRPQRLAPGARPPQFVVFSWDGAGEDDNRLFSRFRAVGKEVGATQTFFLSGLYVLPQSEASRYHPPGHAVGSSDIGFLGSASIRRTLAQLRLAWLGGNEIGTHFNGHFCGPTGVNSWTPAQWKSELRQAKWFVQHWRTTTGWKDMPSLPFDYDRELIGGRTPCLEGRQNLLQAARQMGFRYDSSGVADQVWPRKRNGVWDLSMQRVPFVGTNFEVLTMDYNYLANQSKRYDGPAFQRPAWQDQASQSLRQGFERAYEGNRAPLIVGNHFEQWNGGIYMEAVEEFMRDVCRRHDVRCVSFRDLVDWLDAQNPSVLAKLRTLKVGQRPDAWPGAPTSER
ncbi:hypothetical protein J4573_27520 [Actinomadura barringtoniae]|uniref:Polysaccharide deacetylase n=1 Tax=Actinomadura barringtoniae TaxID=1427535 RepID=A0A939PKK0_9ACTN|nr:hypothetical protein [Actinomadura barringtoniae]